MIWYYVHGIFILLASWLVEGLKPGMNLGSAVATILTGLLVISALRKKD